MYLLNSILFINTFVIKNYILFFLLVIKVKLIEISSFFHYLKLIVIKLLDIHYILF